MQCLLAEGLKPMLLEPMHILMGLDLQHQGFQPLLWHLPGHGLWLAQQYQDNLGANFQNAWNHFIQTGQVWALAIGFIVGYIFRSITAY